MEPKTLAALEISSSKVKGAIGTIGPDGRLVITAVEEIHGLNNVRYGRVQNIREVSAAANALIRKLEESPAVKPRTIRSLGIAIGGRSLSGVPAKAALSFPHECEITDKTIERLAFEATHDFIGDKNVIATIPRRFFVNNTAVVRPVGTYGETLRGEFTMITCARETKQNLDRIKFDTIEANNVAYILRPTALAELILTPDERELGAALVDIGAETTTVAIYKDGTPAYICTLPMGSRLITADLMTGFNLTEEGAEALKHDYADGHEVPDIESVRAYIAARAGEIAANILARLDDAAYPAAQLTKVVLTGGATHLEEFAKELERQGKASVRYAEMPAEVSFRVPSRNNSDNIDIVGLLLAAARRFGEDCLTELPPVEAPVTHVSIDDFPEVATVYDEVEERGSDRYAPVDYDRPRHAAAPAAPESEGPYVRSEQDAYGRPAPEAARQVQNPYARQQDAYGRPAQEAGRQVQDPYGRAAQESVNSRRRELDDENLLTDDPDEPEQQPKEEPRRRGFFGFGRRKSKPAPVVDDALDAFGAPDPYVGGRNGDSDKDYDTRGYDNADGYDDDYDDGYESKRSATKGGELGGIKKALNAMKGGFIDMFNVDTVADDEKDDE
ncbi:MAG: pilus assembly protein PilM [Muribaculaceae bacterium]|nr:pilus assembly protein PilM [Muribaculaceae bacterium]